MGYTFKKNDPKVIKAWTFYDWANSVYNLIISTAIFPIFYIAQVGTISRPGKINGVDVELISFFGRDFVPSEIYSYVYSFAFLIVVLITPILSGVADFTGNKKNFLKFFCYLGALSCASMYFFDVNHIERSMFSVVMACIGFWGSLVYYNAFLLEIADKDKHDHISAQGFSRGYIGSVILLLISLVLIKGVYHVWF